MNRLAWYLAAKRRARGYSVADLAVRLGYRDSRKAVHRILRFERDGHCSDTLLIRLADALALDYATVLELIERDATVACHLNGKHKSPRLGGI